MTGVGQPRGRSVSCTPALCTYGGCAAAGGTAAEAHDGPADLKVRGFIDLKGAGVLLTMEPRVFRPGEHRNYRLNAPPIRCSDTVSARSL